jgi:hypothetical protein
MEKQKKPAASAGPPEERILGASPPAGLPNQTNKLNPLQASSTHLEKFPCAFRGHLKILDDICT